MTSASELRAKFLSFFEQRGHTIVPSSSLLPDDPSVLLTTAGMQQFKKYYTGELDPMATVHPNLGKPLASRNAASAQKSFRTSDIDEVGDESHLTFFEMLGNFSFGGYFKKEAIQYAFDFITKVCGLVISKVTVFEGNEALGIPEDQESAALWKKCNSDLRIEKQGMEDVFWGPTGTSGPCGPTTEIYCASAQGKDVEVWNIVFNEFFFPGSREELLSGQSPKKLEKLPTPGVDTGMGLERLAMIAQGTPTIFETDLFAPLMICFGEAVESRVKRIVSDHVRGAAFLLADGVRPSNKEAGYILRRLIRRVLAYEYLAREKSPFETHMLASSVADLYGDFYPEVRNPAVVDEFKKEKEKFSKMLVHGMKEFDKRVMSREIRKNGSAGSFWDQKSLNGKDAFYLYQTFGFPREVMRDLCIASEGTFDDTGFEEELKKHQELSRAGREAKFGGHGLLLDTGELKARDEEELKKATRLHTATHLLQAALRAVLGESVHQDGSDITAERLRFDFTLDRRLTDEELKKVEDWVNDVAHKDVPMEYKEMPFEEAKNTGALYFAKEKYPATVKVYSAHDPASGIVYSRELCGGPHVTHTGEVGHFRILKQEAVGAGVRRIRATVE